MKRLPLVLVAVALAGCGGTEATGKYPFTTRI